MAKFTAGTDLKIRWNGLDIEGATGATHRIPDAFVEEFIDSFENKIPGLTWITQDELSSVADLDGLLDDKFDKAGGTISGAVTVTGAAILQGALTASGAVIAQTSISTPSVTATTARFKGGPWYDVKAYGATGDGTTDDQAAIQSALDAVPVGFNGQGGIVYFPPGNYRISAPLIVKSRGTRLQGAAGAYSVVINPLSTFTSGSAPTNAALIFQMSDSALPYGTGIENVNIRLDAATSATHGVVWFQSGDVSHMTNMWITGVPSGASGIRVEVDANITSSDISDSIVWTNVLVIAGTDDGSGDLVYLEKCQEMTLVGCKFLGADNDDITGNTRRALLIDTPRGVTLVGCATAHSKELLVVQNLTTSTSVGAVNLYGHTFENTLADASGGRLIKVSGTSARVSGIHVDAPRYFNVGDASIELTDTDLSVIDGKGQAVTLDANCTQNIIHTRSFSLVTDSGSQNAIVSYLDERVEYNGNPLVRRTLHGRVNSGTIGSAGGTEDVVVIFGDGVFDDTSYTASATIQSSSAAAGTIIGHILSKATSSCTVRVKNNDTVGRVVAVNVIAIADT